MSIMISRVEDARQGEIGEIGHPPSARKPGVVERLLANACREASASGEFGCIDGVAGRCASGVIVARRTDEAGNPIGYLLISSDAA